MDNQEISRRHFVAQPCAGISSAWVPANLPEILLAQEIGFLKTIEKSLFFESPHSLTVVGMFANPDHGGNYNQSGQPTCTIRALAYRAGEHMIRMAKSGEIRSSL